MNRIKYETLSLGQKQGLKSNCSISALLAVPAAVSVGVALAQPAQAQTVISTNHYSTVNLTSYSNASPVSITAGTTIAANGAIAGANGSFWSLSNAGFVHATGGDGIELAGGGDVTNLAGGRISAASYGVLMTNVAGEVTNAGVIAGAYDGVSLNHGGSVTNEAGGTISGEHIALYTGGGLGVVANAGLITATSGDAVSLYGGGSLTNAASGRIEGGYSGVYANGTGASIQNAGIIQGTSFGAYIVGAGDVTNTGTITGGTEGVIDVSNGGSLTNSGVITGGFAGVRMRADSVVENTGTITGGDIGVLLGAGSSLTNGATGFIQGGTIGLEAGDSNVINNAGTIIDNTVAGVTLKNGDVLTNSGSIGGVTGIIVNGSGTSIIDTGAITSTAAGGDAINFSGTGANTLTLETGAQVTGAIAGGGSASQIFLLGAGTLGSDITGFGAGSALSIGSGADWTAYGNWTIAGVTNNGIFQPGIVGTPLTLTGAFTQGAGGTMLVAVTPTQTSHFSVSGPVQLGGSLVYVLAPGSYQPASATFLTAGGGITGGFASVSTSGQQAQQQVQQTAAAAASQPAAQSQQGGHTQQGAAQNQSLLAFELGGLGHTLGYAITQNFVVAPAGDAVFADAAQAMVLSGEQASAELIGHAGQANAACVPEPALATAGRSSTASIAAAMAGAVCKAGGWIEATGALDNVDGAYSTQGGGFLAGLDRAVGPDGAKIGMAVGYDDTALTDQAGGKADTGTMRIGLYGAQPIGGFMLTGDVTDGFANTATSRATGIGDAKAHDYGNSVTGGVQIAHPLLADGFVLTPAAGVQTAVVTTGTYDEMARLAAFALKARNANNGSFAPYARMAVSRDFIAPQGVTLTPLVQAGVNYEAANPDHGPHLTAADGTVFASAAPHLAPIGAQFGAGLTASRANMSLVAKYTAAVAGNWTGQTAEAEWQVRF